MNVFSLDLELNQPSGSIIQCGWVIGNILTGEVFKRQCHHVHTTEVINPFITKLTGIEQHHVDTADRLATVYKLMQADHAEFGCFRNVVTWGGGDSVELRKQLKLDDEAYIFGRRWIDLKTVVVLDQIANGKKGFGGLSTMMKRYGLVFEGKKHNAECDAVNTFRLGHALVKRLRVI